VIIRGRNVHKYSALDSSVATGNEIAVAGDIAACYRIHDRLGTTVERVQHLFGANRRPTGERGWFARKRVGAGVVNANAARVLQVQ
jgi:HK97 family phage major capsid protein